MYVLTSFSLSTRLHFGQMGFNSSAYQMQRYLDCNIASFISSSYYTIITALIFCRGGKYNRMVITHIISFIIRPLQLFHL